MIETINKTKEPIKLSVEFMRENQLYYDQEDGVFYVTDTTPFYALEDIRFKYGLIPTVVKVSTDELFAKLEDYISRITNEFDTDEDIPVGEIEDLLKDTSAPVVQLLNSTLIRGIKAESSDIHFEPASKGVKMRFRVDGHLQDSGELTHASYQQLISRVKIIGNMNISERRLPQDGRVRLRIGAREVDLRISTIPTVFGERLVIRILDKSNRLVLLEDLGFLDDHYKIIDSVIKKPYGMIIVTGPTGAGKSTTLYGVLQKIKAPDKNIITVEDPVEYQIEGISQINVKPKIGLTFSSGLRSILRQDPDVIMIGEIRDFETADIAIHASMTGHLVLSTLHTNNAPSSISRLVDLGVQSFLVATSLDLIIAQRLVRRICKYCKEKYTPNDLERSFFNEPVESLYRGKGCEECMGTGYKGRIGVYELFPINEEVRKQIAKNADSTVLTDLFKKAGNRSLFEDALLKAKLGHTSLDEALKIKDAWES